MCLYRLIGSFLINIVWIALFFNLDSYWIQWNTLFTFQIALMALQFPFIVTMILIDLLAICVACQCWQTIWIKRKSGYSRDWKPKDGYYMQRGRKITKQMKTFLGICAFGMFNLISFILFISFGWLYYYQYYERYYGGEHIFAKFSPFWICIMFGFLGLVAANCIQCYSLAIIFINSIALVRKSIEHIFKQIKNITKKRKTIKFDHSVQIV